MTIDRPNLLNKQEVAFMLRCCERTVANWIESGRLPQPVALGGRKYWNKETIESFARHGGAATVKPN